MNKKKLNKFFSFLSVLTLVINTYFIPFKSFVKPVLAKQDKATICHATGSPENPYVEITAAYNAIYGKAGHFNENGTPNAGHEDDINGPCPSPAPVCENPTPAEEPFDTIDLGDPASETSHSVDGWGADPGSGSYGGRDGGGTFSLVVGPQECTEDGLTATFSLNAGSGYADKFTIRHLDGMSNNDSFDVFANGSLVGHYTDVNDSTEGWVTSEFDLHNLTGLINIEIKLTDPIWSGCGSWGQLAINWASISGYTCSSTQLIVSKVTIPDDKGQNSFGVSLFDGSSYIGDEQPISSGSPVTFNVDPGIYWANETGTPDGWEETSNSCQGIVVELGQTKQCTITNSQYGTVQGTKYLDENVNGIHDYNSNLFSPYEDELMNGWTIRLYNSDWQKVGETITSSLGNEGQYRFSKPAGDYYVCEVNQGGYAQSGPVLGAQTIDNNHNVTPNGVAVANGSGAQDEAGVCWQTTLQSGVTDGWLKFGNYKLGTILGHKYEDKDGDLGTTGDQTPVQGWKMTLLQDLAQIGDPVYTAADGSYSFMNLLLGTYTVQEGSRNNWTNLTPTESSPVSINSNNQVSDPVDFVNVEYGTINGKKFNDLNGDHKRTNNTTDPNLPGWTIRLDLLGSEDAPNCPEGTVDGEYCEDVTNASGNYSFPGLLPGQYRVSEVMQDGWVQTRPNATFGGTGRQSDGSYILALSSGDTINNRNFGNYEMGSITVLKNVDTDGDGKIDVEGSGDWTWTIDGKGDYRTGESQKLAAGTYIIDENQVQGYHQSSFYCDSENNDGHYVSVEPGQDVTCTFENTRDTGDIYGDKWNDLDGDGQWGEEPTLEGWTIDLVKGDEVIASETTDDEGSYHFSGIPTGTYKVCEQNNSGNWDQTYPANNGCHEVTLLRDGQDIGGINFGNWERLFDLSIEKSNNKPDPTYAGDTVTYTLVVTNNGNRVVLNPQITDVLPGGFSYVAGSSKLDGVPTLNPTETSGKLTWDLSLWMAPESSITLTYQAATSDNLTDGVYTNLATCKARESYGIFRLNQEISTSLLPVFDGEGEGDLFDCSNIASSDVEINRALDISTGIGGQVLGLSTELPATGSDTRLMFALLGLALLGCGMKFAGRRMEEK